MSRHRDVRNMDYSDDYDGYDDVYGHSIDDDYYISPSNRQFMYNRENSRDQPKIGEFIRTEQDIEEEDESDLADLSDLDKVKVESCLDQIKATIGPLTQPKQELVNIIISNNFNVEKCINTILDQSQVPIKKPEKDVTNQPKFVIPKLNGLNNAQTPFKFQVPPLSGFTVPKITSFPEKKSSFSKLSDLVTNHLSSIQVNDVSKRINDLKITESQELSNTSPNGYKIDLSIALKTTPSGQSLKSRDRAATDFEIPFYDCDIESTQKREILKCSFTCRDILKVKFLNCKRVSYFGKVLCRRYRKRKAGLEFCNLHKAELKKLPRFNFATPSPDDNIIKHLRKQ